jgi:alpha-glucosidase
LFQGEELGFGNATWKSIDEFDDVQTRAQYEFALNEGLGEQAALGACTRFSRDNARTPMQWDAAKNAGFTDGDPWLPVHDDYATCNVAAQEDDPDSPLAWYRSLAALRASRPELIAGDWHELMADDERILAFERTLGDRRCVTLANFSDEEAAYDTAPVAGLAPVATSQGATTTGALRPLEAVVWG